METLHELEQIVLVVPTTTKDYSLQLSLQLPTPTILFNTYKNHIYTTYIHILTCRLTTLHSFQSILCILIQQQNNHLMRFQQSRFIYIGLPVE